MPENIVKYDNYLNTVHFNGLKANELNVIMSLCAKMSEHGNEKVTFTYNELKNYMFIRHTTDDELRKAIKSAAKKFRDVNGEVELPDGKTVYFDLFPTQIDDSKNRTFSIRVNEDVLFILNDLTKNFTVFELKEFVKISGKYSKHLYRLLKQFRNTGKYVVSLENLRIYLDIPKSCENKKIKQKILDPAVKELVEQGIFKNLICEPQKDSKRGSPVIGYTFTFEPEKARGNGNGEGRLQEQDLEQGQKQRKKKTGGMTQSAVEYNSYPQRDYTEEVFAELEQCLLEQVAMAAD